MKFSVFATDMLLIKLGTISTTSKDNTFIARKCFHSDDLIKVRAQQAILSSYDAIIEVVMATGLFRLLSGCCLREGNAFERAKVNDFHQISKALLIDTEFYLHFFSLAFFLLYKIQSIITRMSRRRYDVL